MIRWLRIWRACLRVRKWERRAEIQRAAVDAFLEFPHDIGMDSSDEISDRMANELRAIQFRLQIELFRMRCAVRRPKSLMAQARRDELHAPIMGRPLIQK